TESRAHFITWAWTSGSLDYDAHYEERVRAVTRQGLADYLNRWVIGKPFVFGAMASQKQLDAGLTEERLGKIVGVAVKPKAVANKEVRDETPCVPRGGVPRVDRVRWRASHAPPGDGAASTGHVDRERGDARCRRAPRDRRRRDDGDRGRHPGLRTEDARRG